MVTCDMKFSLYRIRFPINRNKQTPMIRTFTWKHNVKIYEKTVKIDRADLKMIIRNISSMSSK